MPRYMRIPVKWLDIPENDMTNREEENMREHMLKKHVLSSEIESQRDKVTLKPNVVFFW